MVIRADTPTKQLDTVLAYLFDENKHENSNAGIDPMNPTFFSKFYDEYIEGVENRDKNSDINGITFNKIRFMELILEHLVNDGHAEISNMNIILSDTGDKPLQDINNKCWRITYKGYFFWSITKGYAGEMNIVADEKARISKLEKTQMGIQKELNLLTKLIAVGTINAGGLPIKGISFGPLPKAMRVR